MSQGAPKERLRPFKPQRFGRYTLLRPLSTGGMGEIFLARLEGAQGFEKLCVIKKILPHLAKDTDFVERFVDEARILVKLSHGNIAQVLDMGLHDGAPYIALEFVDGKDLRRVVARASERSLQLPVSFSLYVVTRLLDALAYAHRKKGDDGKELNLVHRDISPQNILISYEGEVKVIDFGLAKSTLSATRTHPSIVLGKFLYMSPEQARHQKVDRRSDLYAVGLCLYELVAGKGPFDGVSPGELMAVVANPKVATLSQVEPLCPPALSDVVMKALAPDAAQRFQTAEEFRGRLLSILLELDPAAGPETATRFMTEAFAGEYQSERKMLADLQAQARELSEEPAEPEEETMQPAPAKATREVPTSLPALTLDAMPAAAPPAPAPVPAGPPAATPEALSFQPTRKAPAPAGGKPVAPESSTMPSIVVSAEARMTEEVAQPSIVLDEDLSAESRTLPEARASKGLAPMKSDPARKAATRPSGVRGPSPSRTTGNRPAPELQKPTPPRPEANKGKIPPRATPLEPLEAQPGEPLKTPDQTPAPGATVKPAAPAKKSGGVLVWLALPLFAIAAVGTYIWWDLSTQPVTPVEEVTPIPTAEPSETRKSREVKVPGTEPAPVEVVDDLTAPSKLPKKPAAAAAPPKPSKQVMLKTARILINDVQKNKMEFTRRLMELEKEVDQPGNEGDFGRRAKSLENDLKAAIDAP
ncbi:MAG: protein kinase [Myxococcaceae bacterium]|nr:protein kinase [Myxococcaceae bacterium]